MCHAPMMSVCLCACVLIIMLESLTRQLASSVFSFSSSQSLSFVVVVVCVCGGCLSLPPLSLSLYWARWLLSGVCFLALAQWRSSTTSHPPTLAPFASVFVSMAAMTPFFLICARIRYVRAQTILQSCLDPRSPPQ